MLSLCLFLEELENNDSVGNEQHSEKQQHNSMSSNTSHINSVTHQNNTTFTADEAQKIIDANRNEPEAKAVVNINPKSASDILSQNSDSAQKAANNYTNNSLNAGQRAASLSSGYVNKPQRIPGRLGVNPTFNASTI
jgi:hypothetical protein